MDYVDLEEQGFFTTNGVDIWKLESVCKSPSCTMRNLETGEEENFGLSGLTARKFHRIKMPITQENKK